MTFAFATPLNVAPRATMYRSIGATAFHTSRPSRTARTAVPCAVPRRATPPPVKMLVLEALNVGDMDRIISSADDSLVVIDYSTTWCGPCKIFAPIFEELSDKYEDVVFVKVMGDVTAEASELMKREGIRAVPAFHFWKANERVKDITGARKEDVESSITELK